MYTVRVNGQEVSGLRLDGTELRRKEKFPEGLFDAEILRNVTVECGESDEEKYLVGEHALLRMAGTSYDRHYDEWVLCLQEAHVSDMEQVKGNIAYMAMMLGVEL